MDRTLKRDGGTIHVCGIGESHHPSIYRNQPSAKNRSKANSNLDTRHCHLWMTIRAHFPFHPYAIFIILPEFAAKVDFPDVIAGAIMKSIRVAGPIGIPAGLF